MSSISILMFKEEEDRGVLRENGGRLFLPI